ncbi:MAG TPA: sigma-70 family RNA polymerase sigma factor [Opitutaceae bacterium]|nr:sigma-70 family RNA polymerase sigma factor [Opitutaceae bacterium]
MPESEPSTELDPELLRRAQAGDEAAFGRVMTAHYEHVFRLVHSVVRHEHDARDVCQEVWLTVWKNLGTFRGDAKFTTWLHPIATRKAIDHLRKRRRWYDRFLPISDDREEAGTVAEPVTNETAREDVERRERKDRFETALAALPPMHRTVLALREVQGLAYDEIARAVKIPTGTVMSRLYHARRLLAQKLKEQP